jgi:hypothetical protein
MSVMKRVHLCEEQAQCKEHRRPAAQTYAHMIAGVALLRQHGEGERSRKTADAV